MWAGEGWAGAGAGGQRRMKYIFMQKEALGKGRILEVFLLSPPLLGQVPFQTERKAEASFSLHPIKKEAAKKFLIMLYSVYFF